MTNIYYVIPVIAQATACLLKYSLNNKLKKERTINFFLELPIDIIWVSFAMAISYSLITTTRTGREMSILAIILLIFTSILMIIWWKDTKRRARQIDYSNKLFFISKNFLLSALYFIICNFVAFVSILTLIKITNGGL